MYRFSKRSDGVSLFVSDDGKTRLETEFSEFSSQRGAGKYLSLLSSVFRVPDRTIVRELQKASEEIREKAKDDYSFLPSYERVRDLYEKWRGKEEEKGTTMYMGPRLLCKRFSWNYRIFRVRVEEEDEVKLVSLIHSLHDAAWRIALTDPLTRLADSVKRIDDYDYSESTSFFVLVNREEGDAARVAEELEAKASELGIPAERWSLDEIQSTDSFEPDEKAVLEGVAVPHML